MPTFEGARNTSQTQYWDVMSEVSPDYDLDDGDALKTLRLRSRQLVKDNPIAAGAQQAFINYICDAGPTVKVRGTGKLQTREAQEFIDSQTRKADISATISLAQILEQLVASAFIDGDILINLPLDTKRAGVQTVVELIEAQRVKTPNGLGKRNKIDAELVRHGVKYDTEGRIQGYYVKKLEYMSNYAESEDHYDFYPMYKEFNGFRRRVTWLFKAPLNARPKSSRQYPIMTPVITLFKYMKDYLEAVLIGARVAACFSAFVKSENPNAVYSGMTVENGTVTKDPKDLNRNTKLQPGAIFYMKPNENIEFASPNRPNDNVDAFLVRLQTLVSMALRIPYALLFQDLNSVNYSSWRGGMLEVKRLVGRWRRDLNAIVDWILRTWMLEGMIRGEVRGSLDKLSMIQRWPIFGELDPEKQGRADKLRLQNGTVSRQMIAEEQGTNYEDITAELLEEALTAVELEAQILKRKKELEEELDIIFESTAKTDRLTEKRPGEVEGTDLDSTDAAERRKEDGNV